MARRRLRVLLVGDGRKEGVSATVEATARWLARRARVIGTDLAGRLDLAGARADLILVFGGDGAMLYTARRLRGNQIPVLGVNFGKFGFLTEAAADEFRDVFAAVARSALRVVPRTMLDCRVERAGRRVGAFLALNDAVITRGTISRMVHLALAIDGHEVTSYGGDGLIVATPVGSTAHSLSAGGPIVHPDLGAFVVTPLCPHTLSLRPLVVSAAVELSVEIRKKPEETVLTLDGQTFLYLDEGDRIYIRKAAHDFLLLDTGRRTYFETLRAKFDWGRAAVKV